MTLCFEMDRRFSWRAGKANNSLMFRVTWLWFAVCIIKIPFEIYSCSPLIWEIDGKEYTLKDLKERKYGRN